jgi:hypothetical protein
MAESPNLSSQSERATRLAERFGMTRADIEHLLTQTHSEYSGGPTPINATAETPIAQAAGRTPISETPVIPPSQSSRPRPLSGVALAIIFAILLIGLGIAFSLKEGYFQQRSDRKTAAENRLHPKLADTTRNSQSDSTEDESAPPFQPTTVPPGELPPEAQVSHQITAAHPVRKTSGHPLRKASARPLLQTSSEFDAEERLADLRADGDIKAHIKSAHKHGAVSYQVLTK